MGRVMKVEITPDLMRRVQEWSIDREHMALREEEGEDIHYEEWDNSDDKAVDLLHEVMGLIDIAADIDN